jgi:hypothetical protein
MVLVLTSIETTFATTFLENYFTSHLDSYY